MRWTQKATTCTEFAGRDLPEHALNDHARDDCVVIYGEREDGFIAWASHGNADVKGRKNPEIPLVDLREK